ncbi:conserved hypothetical protein [Candidatus Roizmanbacteria bacterium]|nr:conserved hypothetical protein [Candidatus Roizmanbacteria bacterium]
MSKPKPQYLVSSDSIGFLGRPEQFVRLWKEYFDDKTLDGVEIIAFKPLSRLSQLVSTLEKNNILVLSFHGKTGGENLLNFSGRIIMTLVNFCIVNTKNILINFPGIEFLSHAPYFEKNPIKQIIFKYQPKKIWIENHLYGKKGVEEAIKQIIIYRESGINTCGMLDIFHYVAHSIETFKKDWPSIVEELKLYILLKDKQGKQLFTGIHFPIGSRLGDSLPIDSMTDEMLELFAKRVIPHIARVVFENQQTIPGLFFSTRKMIEKQKARNKRIIERLKKTGVIIKS